jgi:NADPH:quinone reductase-like Zn-dependent oxidoreductase
MFEKGDEVYGSTGMTFGTYAEYIAVPETAPVCKKPSSLTFEEAASIPFGAQSALHFLKAAKIHQGDKVLVYGASGAVGSAVVQIAKSYGAEVTGVTSKVELMK